MKNQQRPLLMTVRILFSFLLMIRGMIFLGARVTPLSKHQTLITWPVRERLFENAFVSTSICAASRATLLTGLYERTHRFTFGTPPVASLHTNQSYPALLRKDGYLTGFIGKWGIRVRKGAREAMFDSFVPLNRSPYFP